MQQCTVLLAIGVVHWTSSRNADKHICKRDTTMSGSKSQHNTYVHPHTHTHSHTHTAHTHKLGGTDDQHPPDQKAKFIRDDDWNSLIKSILYLFNKKKLVRLELDILHEKVRNVMTSKIGPFIVEYYQDSILKKGETDTLSAKNSRP